MIDVHAHLFFDELLGMAGDYGPALASSSSGNELVTGSYRWPMGGLTRLSIDPSERVAALDEAGIDMQVVSLSPLWFFHHTSVDVAGPFLRRANELVAEFCARAPGRLLGLAAIPAQDAESAVAELERAAESSLVGAYFGMDARNTLDAPELDAVYEACVALDLPLFIHSTVSGVDGPPGDPRLERWLGQVTVGYPIEETLAVQALVLGGVLERHPRLDVVLPHGGGGFPMICGRLRDWVKHSLAAPVGLEQFDSAVGRLWFDTHVHSEASLTLLESVANPHHLVYGSNFGGWDTGHAREVASIADRLNANASRLLRLPSAR
ncbi:MULTISPECIES: amidohydrolase family protein [unclassified Rhodococcus (in: high G+C Gram-positive bacteria)]|uniref:amidohydrolase family protein n=1 Tax=unclassified Rhodococcus (in: high G+C Gram-positive bacteria) TaxID=192944 RepID=UPI0015C66686|nr:MULTISPECIES: amidohydrolase family protein [unclassified Rhodococcus (in: high G+C Gram-positive bacteria)]